MPHHAKVVLLFSSMHAGYFIALILDQSPASSDHITKGGFDACYSYFASESVSQASSPSSWKDIVEWSHGHGLDFISSVGPGYNDSKIRPWNSGASRGRGSSGQRYRLQWEAAIDAGSDAVSITSFNEWGEGTQIEPAADILKDGLPKKTDACSSPESEYSVDGGSECRDMVHESCETKVDMALGSDVRQQPCDYLNYGVDEPSGESGGHDPDLYLRITAEMANRLALRTKGSII